MFSIRSGNSTQEVNKTVTNRKLTIFVWQRVSVEVALLSVSFIENDFIFAQRKKVGKEENTIKKKRQQRTIYQLKVLQCIHPFSFDYLCLRFKQLERLHKLRKGKYVVSLNEE